jgi:hypothetical protein
MDAALTQVKRKNQASKVGEVEDGTKGGQNVLEEISLNAQDNGCS